MTWKWWGKKSKVRIEPDPDMAPGIWEWSCLDCPEGNTGEAQEMRAESFRHCLSYGHVVKGDLK
jgi:hypothetical protein